MIFNACSIGPLTSTNVLHTSVCQHSGGRRHRYGVIFGRKDFHGCFVVHHPLVFCLAVAQRNVSLRRFWRERRYRCERFKSTRLRGRTHAQTAVHGFPAGLNNHHENSWISVRLVSLPVCVSRFIFAVLNAPVIYYDTGSTPHMKGRSLMKYNERKPHAGSSYMLYSVCVVEMCIFLTPTDSFCFILDFRGNVQTCIRFNYPWTHAATSFSPWHTHRIYNVSVSGGAIQHGGPDKTAT